MIHVLIYLIRNKFRRYSGNYTIIRNVFSHNRIRSDYYVVANLNIADDFGTSKDYNIIPNNRGSLLFTTKFTTDCYAIKESTTLANNRSPIDNKSAVVSNVHATSYFGA